MPAPSLDAARDLLEFIGASPSPYHCVATAADRLRAAGFDEIDEATPFPGPGAWFVIRGGALIAWDSTARDATRGFRLVGAHTDSPNLRVKPRPDTGAAGFRQLGVEVYGGALYNSWLDRDLGLSGRVAFRTNGREVDAELVRIDRALLRIPQLAIHLDRGVNDGLKLNPQQHLVPLWGLGDVHDGDFRELLGSEIGVEAADVLAWDVMLHDLQPGALLGDREELVSSARLDNQLSCWAAVRAIVAARHRADPGPAIPVICLFDHEEIGSESSTGASGSMLATVLERIALASGCDRDGFFAALAASSCVSADGAHGTHPNYPERHEPRHWVELNGGPVLKVNANVRYATDAPGSAAFQLACERAGVPHQTFVARTDMGCGSTIGPVTSARLGITTIDVGVAQLSMHSARELCGSADPGWFAAALTEVLAGS